VKKDRQCSGQKTTLHCLSFFTKSLKTSVFSGVFRRSLSFGHCIVCPSSLKVWRHQCSEECFVPKDNDLWNTTRNTGVFKHLVKKNRQCNGQKTMIYETLLRTLVSSNFFWPLHCMSFFTKSLKTPVFWGVFHRSLSFGHCIVCPSLLKVWRHQCSE
jgi:predicted nucleic acid-binding Zn ribbon protein